ncbi:MAG: peptidase glycoprotease family [Frankiales bacterium]|nr:peptidase glycoprotease family [Frankiales bacterium]
MLVLVLDTSTPAVSAGLVRVDGGEGAVAVLAERVVVDGRRHGELLAVGVREVLAAGVPDAVVVGVGPGPFTGLRVGIMTAAAFGDARGLPVLGVCSLDGLAGPGTAVVTDARRKEVYWAVYDAAGDRVDGPHVTVPAVAQEAAAGLRVVGDGAQLYGFATEPEPRYPAVARLAEVAVRRHAAGLPALPLTPLYLRRPDAVEPGAGKKVTA